MAENLFVCMLIMAAVLVVDWRRLTKSTPTGRAIYAVVMLYALYSTYGFVSGHPLPNVNDAASAIFKKTAQRIDKALKVETELKSTEKAGGKTDGE